MSRHHQDEVRVHEPRAPVRQPREQPPQQDPQQQPQEPPAQPRQHYDQVLQIIKIQKNLLNSLNDVESFNKSKNDKLYKYLDETIFSNQLQLDKMGTDIKDNLKMVKKNMTKSIHRILELLAFKASMCSEEEQEVVQDVEMNTGEHPGDRGDRMEQGEQESHSGVHNRENPHAADSHSTRGSTETMSVDNNRA